MAEKSMHLGELARELSGDEHAAALRGTLAWFVGELREAGVTGQIGSGLHEKTTPTRELHHYGNGSVRFTIRHQLGRLLEESGHSVLALR